MVVVIDEVVLVESVREETDVVSASTGLAVVTVESSAVDVEVQTFVLPQFQELSQEQ